MNLGETFGSISSKDYALGVVTSIWTIIIIIGNSATIAAFCYVPGLRIRPSDLIFLNLACTDLGLGLSNVLFVYSRINVIWPTGKVGCQITLFAQNIFVVASVFTTVAIVMDRYLLVSREFPKYLTIQCRSTVRATIALIWMYAFISAGSEIILWDRVAVLDIGRTDRPDTCQSPVKHIFLPSAIYYVLNAILPIILLLTVTIYNLCKLRRVLRQIDVSNMQLQATLAAAARNAIPPPPQGLPHHPYASKKRYTNAALTMVVIGLGHSLCGLPFITYTLITNLPCKECHSYFTRRVLADMVRFNSCINPFLYAATMGKIRTFYRQVFRRICVHLQRY